MVQGDSLQVGCWWLCYALPSPPVYHQQPPISNCFLPGFRPKMPRDRLYGPGPLDVFWFYVHTFPACTGKAIPFPTIPPPCFQSEATTGNTAISRGRPGMAAQPSEVKAVDQQRCQESPRAGLRSRDSQHGFPIMERLQKVTS